MEKANRAELARKNFEDGYNCAQSLTLAFADLLPYSPEELSKMSCSFGGGMGRLREVCGAASAMFMVAGMLYGYGDTGANGEKGEQYARIQELGLAFEEKTGSLVCRELLGLTVKHDGPVPAERTHSYYEKRKCGSFVQTAAEILDSYIEKHPV